MRSEVSGIISNKFTYEPVKNAAVNFGTMFTLTDNTGYFNLTYLLGIDEQRDKPIDIHITAENYFVLDTSLVLIPPQMDFNIRMTYAAPIIEIVWFGTTGSIIIVGGEATATPVTQVLIRDYQGITDIDTVFTVFYYVKMGSPEVRSDTSGMKLISQLSGEQGYYQTIGRAYLEEEFILYTRRVDIIARDKEMFSDLINDQDETYFTNQPLFPIVYE